jgi:hypothetical protein
MLGTLRIVRGKGSDLIPERHILSEKIVQILLGGGSW